MGLTVQGLTAHGKEFGFILSTNGKLLQGFMQGSEMISSVFLKEQSGGGGKMDVGGRAGVEAGDPLSNYITPVRIEANLIQGDKVKNFVEKEPIKVIATVTGSHLLMAEERDWNFSCALRRRSMLIHGVPSLPIPPIEKQIQDLPGILLGAMGRVSRELGLMCVPLCLGSHKAQQAGSGDAGGRWLCQP